MQLPAIASKASFYCAFIFAFLWCIAIFILLFFCIFIISGRGIFQITGYRAIVPWFEWVFASVEVLVLLKFGVSAIRERKAVLRWDREQRQWTGLTRVESTNYGGVA